MSRPATTALLVLVGAICLGLLIIDGRKVEPFADVSAASLNKIILYLNDIQYVRGNSLVAFYMGLGIARTRRLRANADTRLQKDINAELAAQIKERSRWTDFEVWVKSCFETYGTPLQQNYLERTRSLPDDPLNYIRFANTLDTLYREEQAALKGEAQPPWTKKEIDDGTARENYVAPPSKPSAVDSAMESYLSAHYKTILEIWPTVEKKGVSMHDKLNKINELLAIKERAPNGFTIRSYALFEEKNFMKPLAGVLKFIMEALAASLQYDDKGKKVYSIDEANFLAGQRMIKESGINFSSWFVPYIGDMTGVKKLSYKEKFALMTFDPNDYNKLLGWSFLFLKTTLDQLKSNITPAKNLEGNSSEPFFNFNGHVEGEYASYSEADGFADAGAGSKAVATDPPGTEEENRPLEGPVKNSVAARFVILNQLEPDFSAVLPKINDIIAEYKKFKKDIEDGKYMLKAPDAPKQ
jgi:hypothetical protein